MNFEATCFSEIKRILSIGFNSLSVASVKRFDIEGVIQVCNDSKNIFEKEPVLLDLDGEFIVVGDLHGHLNDLIRIFSKFGMPPSSRYLFLGDMIDRGEFSFETALFILCLKVLFPDHVYVIRGNHEFESVCISGGFFTEIKQKYGDKSINVFSAFMNTFSYLPIGATITNDNKRILCVHGGIGPKVRSLKDFDKISKPLKEIYGGIADSILWSDPCEDISSFVHSERGCGYKFGEEAIANFLKDNELDLLVRGHSYNENGVSFSLNKKVVTVFSASNYCNKSKNPSGVFIIQRNHEKIHLFPPVFILKNNESMKVRIPQRMNNSLPQIASLNSNKTIRISPRKVGSARLETIRLLK